MAVCPNCGGDHSFVGMVKSLFNHVSRPPSHDTSGDGRFVTDKPTSDPNYAGQRFMSSNISGTKHTVQYRSDGSIID
jgi:hypothetical protein